MHKDGFQHTPCFLRGLEWLSWRAKVVGNETPKRNIIVDFLFAEEDALAGQAEPDQEGGKGTDRADAV